MVTIVAAHMTLNYNITSIVDFMALENTVIEVG
jgi:hypothetical protein